MADKSCVLVLQLKSVVINCNSPAITAADESVTSILMGYVELGRVAQKIVNPIMDKRAIILTISAEIANLQDALSLFFFFFATETAPSTTPIMAKGKNKPPIIGIQENNRAIIPKTKLAIRIINFFLQTSGFHCITKNTDDESCNISHASQIRGYNQQPLPNIKCGKMSTRKQLRLGQHHS